MINKVLTPVKAIRAKCLDCCGGQMAEVRLCPITDCALYPYRMGHRPPKVSQADNLPSDCIGDQKP